jgi:hypothetical protein
MPEKVRVVVPDVVVELSAIEVGLKPRVGV